MNEDFFEELDPASKAKQIFTAYYFKLYLNIIGRTIQKFSLKNRLVYLDFFAGPGKDGFGNELTPLKVIDAVKDNPGVMNNCFLYFNDLYNGCVLKQNVIDKMARLGVKIPYKVESKDSKSINVQSLFTQNDLVLSFVDSFGYQLSDVKTISSLIKNNLSDSIVFINLDHFRRFLSAENEKRSFAFFFGGEDGVEKFAKMFETTQNKDAVCEEIIKDYVDRLIKYHRKKLFCLPIFFRFSNENTQYSHAILVVSKSYTGIKQIKEAFTEVDDSQDDSGKRNENFNFENGKIVVCENNQRGVITVFGDENKKFYGITDYLPKSKEKAVTADDLLNIVDETYMKMHIYCSGYSTTFIKRSLRFLEENGMLGIIHCGKRKRVDFTYGPNTKIYLKEHYENI